MTRLAADFLQWLRPSGPWVLTAIIPDGPTETITAQDANAVDAFIAKHNGKRNIYYSLNPTHGPLKKKASKHDIKCAEFVHADLDPRNDENPEDAKARYLAALETFKPQSSAIIDSGNGLQVLWRLAEPRTSFTDVEACTQAVTLALGGDAGTQNIDRILRLPDTTNLPNTSKVKKGRVACPTKVLCANGATCSLTDFPKAEPEPEAAKSGPEAVKLDWDKVKEHEGWLKSVADLPNDFSIKGKLIVGCGDNLQELNDDLQEAGQLGKRYVKWSAVAMALAAVFKADGRFLPEQIAAALLCPLPCTKHIAKLRNKERAIERLLNRSHDPGKRVVHAVKWRECYDNGMPQPSMHNARAAITALDIECRHDTFHNKILIGFRGNVQHELQSIVGEVSDNSIIALRRIMSDRFGFDLKADHTRDAVISLALENCFDPVCDMLAEAESAWDGKRRLDRMAVDYFNCADTPYNRAMGRIMMIAAVRRARHPGCKYDIIVVLESDEGWNKSGAFQVLAEEDNFSDESILGKRGKEVQEQLAEIWIHENAELAGMKKADVEIVKAFASRQVDIARPAYGRFVVKQKRHSIEVGTTNSDEYLQSQTGNRRFGPLKVLRPIDLDLLRRDRLQLLGEAAKYESAGESITLDASLWSAAREEQEKRRTKDPWEDVLNDIPEKLEIGGFDDEGTQFVRIIHEEDGYEKVASAALLRDVLRIPVERQERKHSMRLADVMRLLGWERPKDGNKLTIGGHQVRGYLRPTGGPLADLTRDAPTGGYDDLPLGQ